MIREEELKSQVICTTYSEWGNLPHSSPLLQCSLVLFRSVSYAWDLEKGVKCARLLIINTFRHNSFVSSLFCLKIKTPEEMI